jgi:anthranilate phosphoribosyltransferase
MKTILEKVLRGEQLAVNEAEAAMEEACSSHASKEQVAAFLSAIRMRGESRDELIGFISYLRKQSLRVNTTGMTVIDTCGTGGDNSNSFNISTAAALLVASQGIKVAKHGGRAVSGNCGSADVLEVLGISMPHDEIAASVTLRKTGFVFLLASQYNQKFANMMEIRKSLGVKTCFNLVGPLLNPACVKRQVLGVYSRSLLLPIAEILQQLGSEEVMVVHSQDGLDEISIGAPTDVAHLKNGKIFTYAITPKRINNQNIKGGDAFINARIIQGIFSGKINNQYRDVVVLNAAAAFVVAGCAETIEEGLMIANQCVDKGLAREFLHQLQLNKNEEKKYVG